MPAYNNPPRKAQKTAELATRPCSSALRSCVRYRGNELMACNARSCRGGCAPSTHERIQSPELPCRNAWEWLQPAELPFALHLQTCEQQEQRAWLVTKREEGESLRWEPDVHLQLHQQQPMFSCTTKSHCRWWQWDERLERVAGHKSHKVRPGAAYKAVQPLHQGCQPVGCQQRKSLHA